VKEEDSPVPSSEQQIVVAAAFAVLPYSVQMASSSLLYVEEVHLVPLYAEEQHRTPFG
jgi:hypothetical protein